MRTHKSLQIKHKHLKLPKCHFKRETTLLLPYTRKGQKLPARFGVKTTHGRGKIYNCNFKRLREVFYGFICILAVEFVLLC